MLAHREPQIGELLGEPDQLLVLRRLLLRAEVRVVAVLLPPGAVDADRLELRAGRRSDPNVRPRGRNRERVQALDDVEDRGSCVPLASK